VIPDFNYAEYAASIGFLSFRMELAENITDIWKAALKADRPVLVEAITDPDISPFPDHVMIKSADKLASSVARGDNAALKNSGHILQQKIEDAKY
jgi:pyruvate dehydrogenase (quinone)